MLSDTGYSEMDPIGGSISVLLVGWTADARASIATALERTDDRLDVFTVVDADSALRRLEVREYDCVVSAYELPDRDGIDLLESVRERDADLPFLLYTDTGSEAIASRAVSAGATGYIRAATAGDDHAALADWIPTAVASYHARIRAQRERERLERFVSVVSHDLRSPLNVAQGRLALARDECESEHLEPAANAVDRSLTLIDDLLTLAREGKTVTDATEINLRELIEACWDTVETADATLVVETDRTIRGDPGRVKQLFENLIGNAVRHGGSDVTVRIGTMEPMFTSTRADSNRPTGIYVADDGPGIPEAERERVFDTGVSSDADGTGFGLNIAREIARAHGWDMRVTESETGGARLEITDVDLD